MFSQRKEYLPNVAKGRAQEERFIVRVEVVDTRAYGICAAQLTTYIKNALLTMSANNLYKEYTSSYGCLANPVTVYSSKRCRVLFIQ